MADLGFIYDFLPGYNPQVVDITNASIRFVVLFSANDEEPASGLIVGKELLPVPDPSLPLKVGSLDDPTSLASLISAPVPPIVGLSGYLESTIWSLALLNLNTVLTGGLNGVFGPDNFKFKSGTAAPRVRARAISNPQVGNWVLIDFWVSPISIDLAFGSLINYPYTPLTPQVVDAGAGGLGAGTYRWAVTALDGGPHQQLFQGVNVPLFQGETAVSGVATFTFEVSGGSGHSATLSWPSAENAVGGYNVYRSQANGSGNVLFLAGSIPNPGGETVSYLDSLPDSQLNTDLVASTTPPWMPKHVDPANPLVDFNYLLWPSTPLVVPPTVTNGGRPGVNGPLFKGSYRYAVTALSGEGAEETAASPFGTISFGEAGHVANLSWQPLVGAAGGYNIYRSLVAAVAGDPGNAVYLAGHVAQPTFNPHNVPTVSYTDTLSDDGLDQNTVPPTGSQLPSGWFARSLGPVNSGSFSASADLELGLTVHLDSWPNPYAATWSMVLNPSIQPTGATATLAWEFDYIKAYQSALVSLGNFFTGGNYSPSGESLGAILQGAESQLSGFSFAANPFAAVASTITTIATAAQTFGFLQCTASTDAGKTAPPLTLAMTHPMDLKPVAYDLSTMTGPGQLAFSQFSLSTDRAQATAGGQLGVSGSGFPSVNQMGIGWTDTCSGFVTGSDVQWGLEGEAPNPPLHLSASAGFKFRPFAPPSGLLFPFPIREPQGPPPPGQYVFRVRNSDDDPSTPLTTTPFSDWVPVWSAGSVDLLLTYVSSSSTVPRPQGPHPPNGSVVGTPTILSDGTLATSITIPPDALPGPATLCAQVMGQSVFCVPITIVGEIEPMLRLLDPSTLTVESTNVYVGYSVKVAGEGFTSPPPGSPAVAVDLYIDRVQGAPFASGTMGAQGSFVIPTTWPPLFVGAHTLIAVETLLGEAPVTASLAVLVEPLG